MLCNQTQDNVILQPNNFFFAWNRYPTRNKRDVVTQDVSSMRLYNMSHVQNQHYGVWTHVLVMCGHSSLVSLLTHHCVSTSLSRLPALIHSFRMPSVSVAQSNSPQVQPAKNFTSTVVGSKPVIWFGKVKIKITLEQATKARRGSRNIPLLFI